MISVANLSGLAIRNDVQTTLAVDALDSDNTLVLNNAPAPFSNPPVPDTVSVLTLSNSLVEPTKIEIVTYTGVTDNGDGTMTITGVQRGQEGTSAIGFSSGDFVYQAITAGILSAMITVTPERLNVVGVPEPGFILGYHGPGQFRWIDPDPPDLLNMKPFADADLNLISKE